MPSFLTDDVASFESSEFEIHKPIADAIATEIRTNNDGSRIALIGDWGTGKSTILSFLSGNFNDEKDFCFVNFDLWAHTGDALKRSFLLRLYQTLNSHFEKTNKLGAVNKKWSNLKMKIKYDVNSTIATTLKTYSPIGIIILSSAVLWQISKSFCGFFSLSFGYKYTFIIDTTILIPLMIGIIVHLNNNSSTKGEPGIFQKGFGAISSAIGVPSIYENTITYSEPIGSIAFENYFKEIMKSIQEINSSITTVVVMDNLDRLSKESLLNAWENIQIFAYLMDQKSEMTNKIWLILPVAEKTITQLLQSDGDARVNHQTLSKLFMIQYRVPKPIRTEWKTSTKSFLKKAFPEIQEDEIQTLITLFNCYSEQTKIRNPREQKRIINEHVALKQVYPNIDLTTIAIYVFLQNKFQTIQKKDLKGFEHWLIEVLTSQDENFGLPPGVEIDYKQEDIAMIAYGVLDTERAKEALLSSILMDIDSIRRMNLDKYIAAAEGTWQTLAECISSEVINVSSLDGQMRYIELLKKICFIRCKGHAAGERKQLLRSMNTLLAKSSWSRIQDSAYAVASLVRELNTKTSLNHAISSLKTTLNTTRNVDDGTFEIWAKNVTTFISQIDDIKFPIQESPIEIDIIDRLRTFLDTVSQSENIPNVAKAFKLKHQGSDQKIIEILTSTRPSKNHKNLQMAIRNSDLLDLDNPKNDDISLQQLVPNTPLNSITYYEMWALFRMGAKGLPLTYLKTVNRSNALKQQIISNAETPLELSCAIAQYLHSEISNKDYSYIQNLPSKLNSMDDESKYQAVRIFLNGSDENFDKNRIQDLLNSLLVQQTHDLSNQLLEIFYKEVDRKEKLPLQLFYALLTNVKNFELDEFLKTNRKIYNYKELIEIDFEPQAAKLYLVTKKNTQSQKYKQWIIDSISQLSVERWHAELEHDQSDLIELMLETHKNNSAPLPDAFEKAFLDKRPDLRTLKNHPQSKKVMQLLSESGFTNVSDKLIEEFKNDSWKIWLDSFGDMLIVRNWFESLTPEEQIYIVRKILRTSSNKHLKRLIGFFKTCVEINAEVATDTLNRAKEILNNPRENDNEDFRTNILELINTISEK